MAAGCKVPVQGMAFHEKGVLRLFFFAGETQKSKETCMSTNAYIGFKTVEGACGGTKVFEQYKAKKTQPQVPCFGASPSTVDMQDVMGAAHVKQLGSEEAGLK